MLGPHQARHSFARNGLRLVFLVLAWIGGGNVLMDQAVVDSCSL